MAGVNLSSKSLKELKNVIDRKEYFLESNCIRDWGGADVIITSKNIKTKNDNIVISSQKSAPKTRLVVTKHSKELSWLFYELKNIFQKELDYISKYDFYGLLAQKALDYLEQFGDPTDPKPLLIAVLKRAKAWNQLPKEIKLPFFAYGLFKPNQLSFYKIQDLILKHDPAEIKSIIKVRDGIPLLVEGNDFINGELIYFKPGYELEAYLRIREFESEKLYRWEEKLLENKLDANVLYGKKTDRGSSYYEYSDWDGRKDPFFSDALEEIKFILNNSDRPSPNDSKPLLRLQMAYMLLWASIERYASLRYYLEGNINQKIQLIAKEPIFAESLKKYVKSKRRVYSSDDLKKYELDHQKPLESIKYYYKVRSNAVHRGKAVYDDYEIIKSSLKELLPIFEDLLDYSWDINEK